MKQLFISFAIIFVLISEVSADEELLDTLFEVMNIDKQLEAGFDAMLPIADQIATQYNLNADAKDELISVYRVWFEEDLDRSKVIGEMKQMYSNLFTEKEIKETIAFYRTPTGKRLLELTPQLTARGAQIGATEAQSKQAQLLARLQPFLEKHNIK